MLNGSSIIQMGILTTLTAAAFSIPIATATFEVNTTGRPGADLTSVITPDCKEYYGGNMELPNWVITRQGRITFDKWWNSGHKQMPLYVCPNK